jgi:hypothetical protein
MVDHDRDATGADASAAEGPTPVAEAVEALRAESFEALEGFERGEETPAPTTPRASAEHRRGPTIGRVVLADDAESSDADDAGAGDVALRKVVVVPSEAGEASGDHEDDDDRREGKSKSATAEDDENYCRICMDPVTSDHLARGDATHLGCSCVSGYMHRACAVEFVVKKNTAVMLCEVCLEEMVGLEVIAAELGERRRVAHRARVAMMVLNGVPPRRHPRRSRRADGTVEHDDDYEWSDPRLDAPGWGSRNPLVWILWILSRPFALAFWVRLPIFERPRDVSGFQASSRASTAYRRRVFSRLRPSLVTGADYHIFSRARPPPAVSYAPPRFTVADHADRPRLLGRRSVQLIRVVVTCRFVILFVGFLVLLSYFLFGFRRDGDDSYARNATARVERSRAAG